MKPKVLIVDDDQNTRNILRAKMEIDECEVAEASNGVEALEMVEKFSPDLILLDVMMPQMDGYETLRILKGREETRYIPVILVTARTTPEDKVEGLSLGAEDYIPKPFNMTEVSARVGSALRTRALQAKLVESEKLASLGEIVDGIAHELRNPLMTVGGLVGRLEKMVTGEKGALYIEQIKDSVHRMEEMVSRIEDFKSVLVSDMKPGDVGEVLKSATEELRHEVEEKVVTLKRVIPSGLPPVKLDPKSLKSAFLNLLENSLEAVTKNGVIDVTARQNGDTIEIIITDDGPGMDPDILGKIFNPFETSKLRGAGLGLTITSRVVYDHGGKIEVKSNPEEGTEFIVTLPVAE